MCYSNSTTSTNVDLAKKYNKKVIDNLPDVIYHKANGFDLPIWPIINQSQEIQYMNWGLVPSWYNGNFDEIALKTLNCRIETADSKSSFKQIINSRRCIIPSSGFFEWQHLGKEKIPYFILSPEVTILSFAGLWDSITNKLTGKVHNTFTILTTEANDFLAQIHNTKKRMPLILNSETEIKDWLSCDSEINRFKESSQTTLLSAHRVDKSIFMSSNANIPEVILPYENDTTQLSLF